MWTERRINIITLALGVALLPPLWAILSPHAGVTTGSVSLICAGLYVTNGNKITDALKIALGFLCGDLWAVLVVWITGMLPWDPHIKLFLALFVFGALAVIIGETLHKYIFTPAWLCGWAIGLTIMGSMTITEVGSLPLEIGAAMIVGVYYVGVGVDAFQKWTAKHLLKKTNQ